MGQGRDGYSRAVAIFKVLLPLAALGILATLFLISRGSRMDAVIPFAEDELNERTTNQQITKPFFSGTTAQGDELVVTADIARPAGPNSPAVATNVDARVSMADGGRIDLTSDRANVFVDKDIVSFDGNVEIETSTGFNLVTDRLDAALDGMSGEAPGDVTGTGPMGQLDAGAMEYGALDGEGSLRMRFTNGVKLVYRPGS